MECLRDCVGWMTVDFAEAFVLLCCGKSDTYLSLTAQQYNSTLEACERLTGDLSPTSIEVGGKYYTCDDLLSWGAVSLPTVLADAVLQCSSWHMYHAGHEPIRYDDVVAEAAALFRHADEIIFNSNVYYPADVCGASR